MSVPHPAPLSGASFSAAELYPSNDRVVLLEQRRLPHDEIYVEVTRASEVATAIRDMVVRGAPAIGISAAYGMVLAAVEGQKLQGDAFVDHILAAAKHLAAARPTAVNLAWAVDRMRTLAVGLAPRAGADRVAELAQAARQIHRDDVEACRAMGHRGAKYLPDEGTVLTHCNAGALATGGYGTALGVIRAAIEQGKRIRVLACETRPYLQGARLTAWELSRDGIPVEIITDGMSAHYFGRSMIDAVVVGADRIARNGDVANKIGTYAHACLAHLHGRPFYVAAPVSTLDPACPSGADIPIEERSSDEVVRIQNVQIAPVGVCARHPAFDVTPARFVSRIFTEIGDVPGPQAAELMSTIAR